MRRILVTRQAQRIWVAPERGRPAQGGASLGDQGPDGPGQGKRQKDSQSSSPAGALGTGAGAAGAEAGELAALPKSGRFSAPLLAMGLGLKAGLGAGLGLLVGLTVEAELAGAGLWLTGAGEKPAGLAELCSSRRKRSTV